MVRTKVYKKIIKNFFQVLFEILDHFLTFYENRINLKNYAFSEPAAIIF